MKPIGGKCRVCGKVSGSRLECSATCRRKYWGEYACRYHAERREQESYRNGFASREEELAARRALKAAAAVERREQERYRKLVATSLKEGPAARCALKEFAVLASAAAERAAEEVRAARAAIPKQGGTKTAVCRVCGNAFVPHASRQVFCSTACRRVQQRKWDAASKCKRRARKEREQQEIPRAAS
jgi:hypothetical protein